jgi:hypothetical protein
MAKGKKGKGKKKKDDKPTERATEIDIINRIILFYIDESTTHEQRLKVWEAVKDMIPKPPDEPKPDDTDGA